MGSKVCGKHEKGIKCVKCLSLADELLNIDDLTEEQRQKVTVLRDKCSAGGGLSEQQVKFLYGLRDEFMK